MPGDKLESIRECAQNWKCSPLTIQRVYDRLKQEGYIENTIGKGSFVTFPTQGMVNQSHMPSFSDSHIHESFLDSSIFDLLSSFKGREDVSIFRQNEPRGNTQLGEALSARYHLDPLSLIILSGAQQGLHLCEQVFNCRLSESILFDDPGFSGALTLFRPRNFITWDNQGPRVERMKNLPLDKIKAYYTVSGIHNPTGITLSVERKKEILALAREHNFYIIEDDYLSEFMESPPLRYVDLDRERTIYIKSFSSVLAGGLRLGMMSVPQHLCEQFISHKALGDGGTSALSQNLLLKMVKTDYFDNHISKCKEILHRRKNLLMPLFEARPWLNIIHNEGYNLWVENRGKLVTTNVPWAKGELFSFRPEIKKNFRLSLLGVEEKAFLPLLKQLESALDETKE